MAAINYPAWSYGETTTWKRTVDEDIILVNQASTTMLRVISPGLNNLPLTCNHTKFEWVEDELSIFESKCGKTAGTASSVTPTGNLDNSQTTFYVNFGEGEYFLAGHLLKVDDELMVVTTAGTGADLVTVARGYGFSSAATHTAGTTIEIVGRLHNEGGDATTDSYVVATLPYNYTQIWQQEFELTSTEMAVLRYGDVNRLDYLEGKALKHQMSLMERNFINGSRVERTTKAAIAATSGSSGGLLDTTAAYIYASNRNNLSTAALTRNDVLDLLQEQFALVGVEYMPTDIFLNSWLKRKMNSFFETYVRTDRADTVGGALTQSILTDYGELDLHLCPNVPAGRMFLLHSPFCAIGPLNGQEFKTVQLAQTTALAQKFQLVGEYTNSIKNPKCHGEIYGASTSS
jgi:hypothetical protein